MKNAIDVLVLYGDITQVEADALIAPINSGGLWFGGIDGAIQKVAGNTFHAQAAAAMPLKDGQIIFAPGPTWRQNSFKNVLFVVDDLEQSIYKLVLSALNEAEKHGLKSVSIPTIRTGVMAGIFETRNEALSNLAVAVSDFRLRSSNSIESIAIVIYDKNVDKKFLERYLY